MKRNIILMFLVFSTAFLMADLVIDIPFDLNIIGDDYSEMGDYTYESEWITLTNTGSSTQTYFFMYEYDEDSLPADWYISCCNPITCFLAFFNVPIELAPGASEQISIHIGVTSTGGTALNMIFSGGDLAETVNLDVTFNTADNVNSADNIILLEESVGNYPNPFNPETAISFSLAQPSEVKVEIYNLNGQLIRSLAHDMLPAGENNLVWDGSNDQGKTVTSGIYLYKLKAGDYTSIRKMTLMK